MRAENLDQKWNMLMKMLKTSYIFIKISLEKIWRILWKWITLT